MAADPASGAEVLGYAGLCLAAPSGEDSDGVVVLCTPRLVSSQGLAPVTVSLRGAAAEGSSFG